MALIRFKINDISYGFVRNNKASSTTFINYLGQLFWNEIPTNCTGTVIKNYLGEDSYIGQEKGFDFYKKELLKCDVRIALFRDPIQKLVSGYNHCLKQSVVPTNFDDFLNNYENYMKINYVRIHCRTNTALLGPSKTIYTHIFNSNDINIKVLPFLENISNKKLVPTHLRKTKHFELNDEQINKIKVIVKEDYENKWFE